MAKSLQKIQTVNEQGAGGGYNFQVEITPSDLSTSTGEEFVYLHLASGGNDAAAFAGTIRRASITILEQFGGGSVSDATLAIGLGDGSTTIDSEDYIKASTPVAGDNFGAAVSLSSNGNTLAVGAINGASGVGSVYILKNGGAWGSGIDTEQIISPDEGTNGDNFGRSVSLRADATTVAIGANLEDSAATGVDGDETDDVGATDSGAAYLWNL